MNIALILAGGIGNRIGSNIPKQFIEIAGKPVLYYTLQKIALFNFDKIVIVILDKWRKFVMECACSALGGSWNEKVMFASAGRSRQESVLNGLKSITTFVSEEDMVVIHDAARPCVTRKLLESVIDACRNNDGAMPVLPVKDTVYASQDGKNISGLLNRDSLYIGQAPECFRFGAYYKACSKLSEKDLAVVRGSSEVAFLKGLTVALVEGDERNFKITTPSDLERFKEIVMREEI